ncbi:MAG: HEAT repeat domain-containing protein [Verrucomicrobia bacterium]|nr:HEAT repeat domain-containing protein [Verrucomicrobiota bacterium]
MEEKHRLQDLLLERVKQSVGELEKMWQEMNDHWTYEDPFYRFYHGSYKTYTVQDTTVRALSSLRPTVHAVIPALESALQDTNREVRHYASVALQKIKAVSEKRQLTTDH